MYRVNYSKIRFLHIRFIMFYIDTFSDTGEEADLPELLRPEGAGVDDGESHQIYQGIKQGVGSGFC